MSDPVRYRLYVPARDDGTYITPGSAIVGEEIKDGYDVHYERGGASNVQTFEEKILHAAGRRKERYPTAARSWFPKDDLTDVGSVRYDADLKVWVIEELNDPEALAAWAPGDHVVGGSQAMLLDAASRAFSSLPPLQQRMIMNDTQAGADVTQAILAALRSLPR